MVEPLAGGRRGQSRMKVAERMATSGAYTMIVTKTPTAYNVWRRSAKTGHKTLMWRVKHNGAINQDQWPRREALRLAGIPFK